VIKAQEAKAYDAYHSTTMEGYRISADVVEAIINGRPLPGGPQDAEALRAAMAVQGYSIAFDRVLQLVRKNAPMTGGLILDLFNPSIDYLANRPIGVEMPEGPPFTVPDGRQVERSFQIVSQDRFAQVNRVELIYDVRHTDGRKERQVHAFMMRHLFRYEAEHLLARSGFVVEQLYADYDRSPYGSTYPGELIFVARKVS